MQALAVDVHCNVPIAHCCHTSALARDLACTSSYYIFILICRTCFCHRKEGEAVLCIYERRWPRGGNFSFYRHEIKGRYEIS